MKEETIGGAVLNLIYYTYHIFENETKLYFSKQSNDSFLEIFKENLDLNSDNLDILIKNIKMTKNENLLNFLKIFVGFDKSKDIVLYQRSGKIEYIVSNYHLVAVALKTENGYKTIVQDLLGDGKWYLYDKGEMQQEIIEYRKEIDNLGSLLVYKKLNIANRDYLNYILEDLNLMKKFLEEDMVWATNLQELISDKKDLYKACLLIDQLRCKPVLTNLIKNEIKYKRKNLLIIDKLSTELVNNENEIILSKIEEFIKESRDDIDVIETANRFKTILNGSHDYDLKTLKFEIDKWILAYYLSNDLNNVKNPHNLLVLEELICYLENNISRESQLCCESILGENNFQEIFDTLYLEERDAYAFFFIKNYATVIIKILNSYY